VLQPILCGWFGYLAILALLMTASAGWHTWLGKLGAVAAVAAASRAVAVWRPLFGSAHVRVGAAGTVDLVTVVPDGLVLVVAVVALVAARRQDTRLIALLLVGAALFPLALYFW